MKHAFVNATVLDGTRDMQPLANHAVLIEDDRITAVLPMEEDVASETERLASQGFDVVDLGGRYLMPGLINLHVHLAGSGAQEERAGQRRRRQAGDGQPLTRAVGHAMVANFAKTQLMSGTTTIRTVGGIADFDTRIRDLIADGKRSGRVSSPRTWRSPSKRGHMAGSLAHIAHTPEEARAFVRAIAEDEPDLIKIMITGGVLDAKVKGARQAAHVARDRRGGMR